MITLDALPDELLTAMRAYVTAAYPREACGVVLRRPDGGYDALHARNAAPNQAHRFWLDPRDMLQIAQRLALGNDDLVVIYHSHCDTPALLSERDRHFAAAYPDVLHLIFAVTARGVLNLHTYRADGLLMDAPSGAWWDTVPGA